jgi:hypothetical protein
MQAHDNIGTKLSITASAWGLPPATDGADADDINKIRSRIAAVELAKEGIPLIAIVKPYSQLDDYIEVFLCSIVTARTEDGKFVTLC